MKKRKRRKPLTIHEFASLGGKARARKLSKERQSEIGRNAVNARWEKNGKCRKP